MYGVRAVFTGVYNSYEHHRGVREQPVVARLTHNQRSLVQIARHQIKIIGNYREHGRVRSLLVYFCLLLKIMPLLTSRHDQHLLNLFGT